MSEVDEIKSREVTRYNIYLNRDEDGQVYGMKLEESQEGDWTSSENATDMMAAIDELIEERDVYAMAAERWWRQARDNNQSAWKLAKLATDWISRAYEAEAEGERYAELLGEATRTEVDLRRENAFEDYDKLRDERDRLREALSQYADPRKWRRNYDGTGYLNVFQADTNGPYIAFDALHPTQQEDGDE